MFNSRIVGMGHYVPENVVTNDDLSKFMDTSDSWIQERTGVKERRWAEPNTGNTTSEMGVKAAKIAIENATIDKHEIDFIILLHSALIIIFLDLGFWLKRCWV